MSTPEIFWQHPQKSETLIPFWHPGYNSLISLINDVQDGNTGAVVDIQGIDPNEKEIYVAIKTPFMFDRRKLRNITTTIYPHIQDYPYISDGFPQDFVNLVNPKTQIHEPENFQIYVTKYIEKIREDLKQPNLTQQEALDALVPNGDFNDWETQCKLWGNDYTY